jgi:hypothetical protein
MWKHISAPESIEMDGHVYHTNKILLDSLPADIVQELARRRMEQRKAAKEAQTTHKKKRKPVPA